MSAVKTPGYFGVLQATTAELDVASAVSAVKNAAAEPQHRRRGGAPDVDERARQRREKVPLPDFRDSGLSRGLGARASAPHLGEPLGADGNFVRPALQSPRMDLECTGRARSRAGAAARSKPPWGPAPRADRRLKGVGGWVSPLWVFLARGASEGGIPKGGNQGGGREARPVLTVFAGRPSLLRGGRGDERRSSRGRHRERAEPVARHGTRSHEEKREAKRRLSAGHIGCHSEAAVTVEHGLVACSCIS